MVAILGFIGIVLPYQVCFLEEVELEFIILNVLIDLSFLIDIILTFFTAVKIPGGELITNRKIIAQRYLKGWFLFDLTTTLPF